MTELAKATLTELNASNRTVGEPLAVQFNPASLRMQLSNRSSGGAQAGSPARQRAGEGSLSLSFDLQFDSADEGTAEAPVSVLRKTDPVQRFVRPRGNAPGEEAPPRVQLEWGGVKVQGVMESLSLDLDLFAFDGTPLRARCAVQIKGQDPAYACAPQGAGAGGAGAGAAAAMNAALQSMANVQGLMQGAALADALGQGLSGAAKTLDGVTRALSGESLPQLAQRAGLDPKAWRDLAPGPGANPLSMPAGREVAVPKAGAASQGPQPGALGPAIGAALGQMLSSSRRLAPAEAAQLTRSGGVGAAQTQLRREAHQGGASKTLAGFRQGASAATSIPRAPIAVPEDRPFGHGLPLKPRRAVAAVALPTAEASRRRCACAPIRCRCGGV